MGGTGTYTVQQQETFGQFIWNSDKKTFLGRTGTSWCKIGAFYVVFYLFLAGFMGAMLAIFYQTLDTEHQPKYIPGDGGSILKNPAMGYRPSPKTDNIESSLIWYKNADNDSISHWVDNLNEFMAPYEGGSNKKTDTKYVVCSDGEELKKGEECQFTDLWLEGNCSKASKWGYASNSPCIILKMNRMFGWNPKPYETIEELPKDMPDGLITHITDQVTANNNVMPKMIWVSCVGENPSDQEYLGDLKYSPWQGFPSYYFPFRNTPGYVSPIVSVEFQGTKPNVLINIECRAWARNIKYDRGNRFGLVSFQLLID